MLQQIKNGLDRWSPLQIPLFGKISVLKVNILPWVNFCLFTIPLTQQTSQLRFGPIITRSLEVWKLSY